METWAFTTPKRKVHEHAWAPSLSLFGSASSMEWLRNASVQGLQVDGPSVKCPQQVEATLRVWASLNVLVYQRGFNGNTGHFRIVFYSYSVTARKICVKLMERRQRYVISEKHLWGLSSLEGGLHGAQKTGDTVDGSEIRLTSWYGKYPIIYKVYACWVVQDFFHQQYW